MARIRSIKPEFCVSEQLAECSTNARLVFALMWMFCDDQGIHPAKPRTLKGEIFPLDEAITTADVTAWINDLIQHGLLREYEVEGERYWIVTGWKKHQKIDKPSKKHPLPLTEDSPSPPRKLADASPPEWKGRESKGVEGKGEPQTPQSASPGIEITPTPGTLAARAEFPNADDPRVQTLHGIAIGARSDARVLHAQQWVSEGVTEEQLREALTRARAKKPGHVTIPVAFLQCFVHDVQTGVGARASEPRGADAIPIAIANLAAKAANGPH